MKTYPIRCCPAPAWSNSTRCNLKRKSYLLLSPKDVAQFRKEACSGSAKRAKPL